MNKIKKLKEIVQKTDISKIAEYSENNPNSKTLRQIISYNQRILNSNNEKEIFKLAVSLAYNLDTIVNVSKYVNKEEEKKYWLGISEELFMNTKGVKK